MSGLNLSDILNSSGTGLADSGGNGFDFGGFDLANPPGGGFDWSSVLGNATTPGGFDFGSALTLPNFDFNLGAPETLPGGGNVGSILSNLGGLFQTIYEGESRVQEQKLLNQIAQQKLKNQLETVRTTPNVWLALGAAGVAAFLLFDRRDSRRYK